MRKRKKGKKFSRVASQRKALVLSLSRALLLKERIKTTKAKAKSAAQFTEKLITVAKQGGLPAHRRLRMYMNEAVAKKLLSDLASRYENRQGGYTRITKLGKRQSDSADMALVELLK